MTLNIVSFVLSLLKVLVVILVGTYIYFKYVIYNYWRKRGVIHEDPIIPVGNFADAFSGKLNPGEIYMHQYNKFKKYRYFGSYILFKPNLIITDPDLMRIVLTKEFAHFHDRNLYCNEKIDPLTGHLFLLRGQKWKNLRIKLRPIFTPGKLKLMFNTFKNVSDELHKVFEDKVSANEVVEIKEICIRFTTDLIMNTAFGIKCNSLHDPNCEYRYWGKQIFKSKPFKNALFIFASIVLDIFRIPYFEKEVSQYFINTFQQTIKQRTTENYQNKHDIINLLIQLMKYGCVEDDDCNIPSISEHVDGKITILESCAQAFVFFIAGFETSSAIATFCLYELAMNYDIQEKLRNEINMIINKHGGLTYESVNEMQYLHKVFCETVRKYPVIMYLNRICTKDIVLPTTDLHIKKGTDVIIPVLGIHRDPEIYPEPMKFDPERFSEENIATRHPYHYIPFGEGPRSCIAMRFGTMQTKIAVIRTVLACRFTLAPGTPVPIEYDAGSIFLTAKSGIYLQLKPI